MIEFKAVSTPRHDRFEETITNLLNEGWELHGSPFVSQSGAMTQSLTRTMKTSNPVKSKK
jgi:hypothetical protein